MIFFPIKLPPTCIAILAMASALTLISCDSHDLDGGLGENNEAPKEITWDWSAFPESTEMVLSTLPMDIQPKESFSIKSEASGIITLEVKKKISQIEKDAVIARMNVETLSEQEERLRIMQEKDALEDMKAEELDRPEEQKKAREELEKAKLTVRRIEMALKNPRLKEYFQEMFGGELGELNQKSLQDAKDALSLAERKLAWHQLFGDRILKGQKRIKEMDLTKNKRQHEEAKERSVYKAPFSGELRLEVNYTEGVSEYTVSGRETIATLNNFDEIHGVLKVGNAKWVNVMPEQLYVQLHDRNRTVMHFNDDRMEKDGRSLREERKYIFSIPLQSNQSLKRLVGTQMKGDLVYKLPTKCYIVPKYDLSLYALGKTDSTEWHTMVSQLWTDVSVVAEGRKYIALARTNLAQ